MGTEDLWRGPDSPYAADNKRYMRAEVAGIIERTLDSLNLEYPAVSEEKKAVLKVYREKLETEED